MPKWIEVPDETDQEAAAGGLLYYAEAARRFNRSVTWVKAQALHFQLDEVEFAGRRYITTQSVNRLLESIGGPLDDLTAEIERGFEPGNKTPHRHAALVRRAELEQQVRDFQQFGIMPTVKSPTNPKDAESDPLADFINEIRG